MKLYLLMGLGLLFSCNSKVSNELNNVKIEDKKAQEIVDDAISAHGGKLYNNLDVEFDFRKYHYHVTRKDGTFNNQRSYNNESDNITETLNNNGVVRTINGIKVDLEEKMQQRIAGSINSQVYFALLPYALNDPAVIKKYIGEKIVEGQPYHKVQVTFLQEGGGADFDDVYIYWFHKEKKTMDYLAYEFHVNKGGFRFRKAYNVRNVGGIIFADYINYKESDATTPLVDYDKLLDKGKLEELSRIKTENVIVN